MRHRIWVVVLAALGLAACSEQGQIGTPVDVPSSGGLAAVAAATGYTFEVFASEGDKVYVVTNAETGETTAARAQAGVSTLLGAREARVLLGERQSAMAAPGQEVLNFGIPGFSLSIKADGQDGDNAQVAIQAGGQTVHVNAADEAAGGNALVRITGASADDARDFIKKADELDPGVQQQMLDALNL